MPRHATEHQKDLIRKFNVQHRGNEIAICEAYALAETDGRAFRKRGDYRLDSHAYARALLAHGREQGWLAA